jgi:AcrR family transcriptional regulator
MTSMLKRDRLLEAAKTLFYQQGVTGTTLADIAEQAEVPLGNVYYHFRTKHALVDAVIQAHVQELQSLLARWEHVSDSRQRLLALLATVRDEGHVLARSRGHIVFLASFLVS